MRDFFIILAFAILIIASYKPRKERIIVEPIKINLTYKLTKVDAG